MICEACGKDLEIGSWPFCRDGHRPARSQAIQTNEAFIGGMTIHNLGDEPVTVYSREEFQAQMRAHGVTQRIKHVPGDKHLSDWSAGIDAQTLANAAALVARQGQHAAEAPLLPSLRNEIRLLGQDGAIVATRDVTRRVPR